MDPFKTLISNTNQLKLYSDKPLLIFFARAKDLIIFKVVKTLDGIELQLELNVPIKDTLIEAIGMAFQKMAIENGRQLKMIMIMDDVYLTMHRVQLGVDQLKSLSHALELEIDHLNEFTYDVSFAPTEVKQMVTVLVYAIKKANLNLIEQAFLSEKALLRRLVSRYHAVEALLAHKVFDIDPEKPCVIIDVGATRTRLFILFNDTIKVYRRMPMRLDEKVTPNKQFQSVLSSISSFVQSSIESFVLKTNSANIHAIYMFSDFLDIPSKAHKINGVPLLPIPIKEGIIPIKGIKDLSSFLYVYGMYLMMFSKEKFNLIPFMKRFERFGLRLIIGGFFVGALVILGANATEYFKLKKEYSSYKKNHSKEMLIQAKKKREMVELRERINKQKKIIDYADLTTIAYKSDVSVDDFLYQLTAMSSPDISFAVLRIRNKKITITGTSSSVNGNYSFYMFLQQLESLPYLGRIHYSLGMGGAPNASSFTIEVFWEDD